MDRSASNRRAEVAHRRPDDAELCRLLASAGGAGYQEAARQLVERHQGLVFGYLRRSFRLTVEDASEVSQDVFVRFLKGAPTAAPRRPTAYLLRIAHNLGIDLYRRRSGRNSLAVHSVTLDFDPPDEREPELDTLAEQRECVEKAAAVHLSPKQRQVVLRRLDGMSIGSIAAELGTKSGTVSVHLSVAIRRLREALDNGGGSK